MNNSVDNEVGNVIVMRLTFDNAYDSEETGPILWYTDFN